MAQDLSGKIAFVTGSGRGLGNVMARKLAARGADVVVHDLSWDATSQYGEASNLGDVVKQIEAIGVRSMGVTGNIGDRDAVAAMRKEIEEQVRPGRNPRQLRRRRYRRLGQQARAQQHPRHHLRRPDHADQQQPDRHHAGHPGVRAADGRAPARHRRQHRLGRRPYRRLAMAASTRPSRPPSPTTPAASPTKSASTACASTP